MLRIVEPRPKHARLLIGYAWMRSQAQISQGDNTAATEGCGIMSKENQHEDATGCNSSEQDEGTKSFQADARCFLCTMDELLCRTPS